MVQFMIESGDNSSVYQDKIFFMVHDSPSESLCGSNIVLAEEYVYYSFNNDFGPHNLSTARRFCARMRQLYCSNEPTTLISRSCPRQVTNAAFLLGCFLVVDRQMDVEDVCALLKQLERFQLAAYPDATRSNEPDGFTLSLHDCLLGIDKAARCGYWADQGPRAHAPGFTLRLYQQLDDPRHGDLQFLVPGTLLSLPDSDPPADDGRRDWFEDGDGLRRFSPALHARALRTLGVRSLLRLSGSKAGDRAVFEQQGVAVQDLDFQGQTTPPAATAVAFLLACDERRDSDGPLALQCRTGLGRSATLAGLWLMRERRFGAREAVVWLRVMRPGAVLGEQQGYLEGMQAAMWRLHDAGSDKGHAALLKAAGRAGLSR